MLIRIEKLLDEQALAVVDEIIAGGEFVEGAETAGAPARSAKNNLQLEISNHPRRDEFLQLVNQAVNSQKIIRAAVVPRRMTLPLISKYETSMTYGWHIDNPVMQGLGAPVRTDVACTVFLSPADSYDGGALQIRGSSGDIEVKLNRGDALFYPATSRHQVTEVSRGNRLAMVFWIQSMIADAAKREILYDLEIAYDQLYRDSPQSEATQSLQRAQSNLVRHWGEV